MRTSLTSRNPATLPVMSRLQSLTLRHLAWRLLTGCLLSLIVLIGAGADARAADYPNHLIRVYMGYPAGTYLDIVTRHFTERLSRLSGQVVIVENKVGANGMMAMEAAARSKPDGYTLVFGPGLSASAFQYKSLPFDPVKDFTRVGAIVAFPFVLLVNPRTTPVNSVEELTEFLKKKSGKISYGAPNTLSLIAGSLFANAKGLDAAAVPYKNAADAIRDLNAGDLDFIFNDAGFALAQMREGRLRGLAVTLPHRAESAPDLPTMIEAGVPEIGFFGWMGVYMPAGVAPEITNKLAGWLKEISNADDTKAFFRRIGADSFYLMPDEFTKFEEENFKEWEARARVAGIQPQ
jgi:tripartite-type tricarboxylate transporter receptor subunit TctC